MLTTRIGILLHLTLLSLLFSDKSNAQCSVDLGINYWICDGDEITLIASVSGGVEPYEYVWSNDPNDVSEITFTPAGDPFQNITQTYSVTVTDGNGCVSSDDIEITVRSMPEVSLSTLANSCNSGGGVDFQFFNHPSRGAIEFSVNGGSNYLSSIPDNSGSVFYSLSPGNYHAFSRWGNNQCPVDLGPFTVADDGTGISFDVGPNVTICDGESITLTPNISGTTGAVTYTWVTTDGSESGTGLTFSPIGSPTQNITKTYDITATDANGCAATDQISIQVSSNPTATFTITDASCSSTSGIEFTFPNHPNRGAIKFSLNGGSSYYGNVPDNSSSRFYALAPGNYHAFVRWGDNSCPVDLGPFTINDDGTSISLNAGPNVVVCDGDAATLNATLTGGTQPVSYTWVSTDGTESGSGLTITPVGVSTHNINRYYNVTATDANGCSSTDQVRIQVRSRPTVTFTTTDASCNSVSGIEFSFPNHPNRGSIRFSLNGGSSYYGNVADNSGSVFYPLPPGNYHAFSRWGDNSCPIDLGTFTINDDGTSMSLNAGPNLRVCNGDPVTLNTTLSGGTQPISYTWASTDGTESGTGLTFTPGGSASQNINRNYNITATDANGCFSTDQVSIEVRSKPTAAFTITNAICNTQGQIEFDFPNHPNRSGIEFSLNGGSSYYGMVQDNQGSVAYNLPEGSYHAAVRWGDNSCEVDLGPFTIGNDGAGFSLDAGIDQTICNGETATLSPTVTNGVGPFSYSWVSTNGPETGTGTGSTLDITPLTLSGSHTDREFVITVTDSRGCTVQDNVTLRVLGLPVITNVETTNGCGSTPAEVTINFLDHAQETAIEFSIDGGSTYLSDVPDNSGSITYSLPGGDYHLFVRWSNDSCPVDLGQFTLEYYDITLEIGSDLIICNGEEIDLVPSVTGGVSPLSYTWTNGSDSGTGTTFTPTGSNTMNSDYSYVFTVSDANGCTDTDDLEISVKSAPTATVYSAAADCDGNADIRFEFPNHPQYGGIAFSLDGGVTYEAPVPDASGTVSYPRAEGIYDTYVMWHTGLCPTQIGEAEVAGGNVFHSAASGNASDIIWTVPGSSNLFAIDFCEERSLVISSGTQVTSDLNIQAEDLTIENSATLDLSANNYLLEVFGDLTNTGTFEAHESTVRFAGASKQIIGGDYIKFHDVEIQNIFDVDLATTMEVNGAIQPQIGTFNTNGNSLILVSELVNGDVMTGSISEIGPLADVIGDIEIQRYVQSLNDGFRYIGMPIRNQTVGDFQGDFVTTGYPGSDYPNHYYNNITYYDESDRTPGDSESGFKNVTSTAELVDPEKGYVGYFPPSSSANLLTAEGPFNKGNITFNLSYTDLGTPNSDGWHLIPNPYPSAIDIMSSSINLTNVDRAIYIIDHELGSDWKGEYVVYNNGVSVNGATNIIASYQAFMIKANGPGASISFSESCKSDEQGIFYRNQQEERPLLRFSLSQQDHKFETVVAFHEDATGEFDSNFDAYRKESLKFSIGTLCNADTLCINTQQSYNEEYSIPVHVFTQEEGEFTFSLDEIQNINSALCIRIDDLVTGEQFSLTHGEAFTFSSEANFDDVRFVIHSVPAAEITVQTPSCIQYEDGTIQIEPSVLDTYTFTLTEEGNPEIQEVLVNNSASFDGLSPGVYEVEMSSENGVCSDAEIPVLVGAPVELAEPSISFVRDECEEGSGKIFISANHDSELHVTVYQEGELISEAYGFELIEVENLSHGSYSVDVFDQCSEHEFGVDLNPILPLNVDFFLSQEMTLINGIATVEMTSDTENALHNSWLVNGEWLMEGDRFYHEFTESGEYDITLVSRNGNCEKEVTKTISILDLTSGVSEITSSDFSVSMTEEFIEISNTRSGSEFDTVELFDVSGKQIDRWEAAGQTNARINHSHLPPGVYVIRLFSEGTVILKEQVVK